MSETAARGGSPGTQPASHIYGNIFPNIMYWLTSMLFCFKWFYFWISIDPGIIEASPPESPSAYQELQTGTPAGTDSSFILPISKLKQVVETSNVCRRKRVGSLLPVV